MRILSTAAKLLFLSLIIAATSFVCVISNPDIDADSAENSVE